MALPPLLILILILIHTVKGNTAMSDPRTFRTLPVTVGPRCPTGEEEAFAWGFLVGYLGKVPRIMADAFDEALPLEEDGLYFGDVGEVPDFLADYPTDALAYRRGYEAGCGTATDHLNPEDREG